MTLEQVYWTITIGLATTAFLAFVIGSITEEPESHTKKIAKLFFISPIWPLALVVVVSYWVYRICQAALSFDND